MFIDYSQAIDDDYEHLGYYNPTNKSRVLLTSDNIRVDIEANKMLIPIVT